jgi:hypothetical protein
LRLLAAFAFALLVVPALALARPGEIEAEDPDGHVLEAAPDREVKARGLDPEPAAKRPCPLARPAEPAAAATPSPAKVRMPAATPSGPVRAKPGCPFVRHAAPQAGELLDDPALGTRSSPVLCGEASGERAYLARLRCRDRSTPDVSRLGTTNTGPDGHVLDVFQLSCPRGLTTTVLLDRFHLGYVETRPVEGFTIVAP